MNNFEKIKMLLEKSNLSTNEKDEFLSILAENKENELAIFLELLEKDLEYANFVLKNYRIKKGIIENKDEKNWEELLESEKEIIENL